MFRFPFGPRPMPHHMPQKRPQETPPPEKKISYDDLMKNASFSSELSFLLAMTLKDGMSKNTVMDMLGKIEPHVSGRDKDAIRSILGARNMTEEFRKSTPDSAPRHTQSGLSGFSKHTRQQSLLNVLQSFASNETGSMMNSLSQSVKMQEDFMRMNRRMEALRNNKNQSPEQMFEALSMFMPEDQQSEFRNMSNMMRMMGSMDNFKPEDIFKFMGSK